MKKNKELITPKSKSPDLSLTRPDKNSEHTQN
jgi:hypothetical protein